MLLFTAPHEGRRMEIGLRTRILQCNIRMAGMRKPGRWANMKTRRRKILWRFARSAVAIAAVFAALSYFVLPMLWRHYEHDPALAGQSMRTETAQRIAGDPLNIGLVGSREEVIAAFTLIGWRAADALSLSSDLKIAGSIVLDRPYDSAPVSRLFYEGREQDLAFEKEAGASADQRHHVRFWKILGKSPGAGSYGRAVWLGAVSFDKGVGLSHYTGQITHHIDANLDAERDGLVKALADADIVDTLYQVTGSGPAIAGRNGGGDKYFTDGELTVAVLRSGAAPAEGPPETLENPPMVKLKQTVWHLFAGGPPR
jgi:LssY C-terminus